MVESAWSATRVKNCFFRKKYESLIARRGKKRALIAVAHKILCAAYHILTDRDQYKELGYDFLEKRRKTNQIQSYLDKLKDLGVVLDVKTIEEANALLETDPAIKEKLLAAELYQWYGSAALPAYLEASDKIWKNGF